MWKIKLFIGRLLCPQRYFWTKDELKYKFCRECFELSKLMVINNKEKKLASICDDCLKLKLMNWLRK